jgi:hypothetical protein
MAVSSYLEEVSGYVEICGRHEKTTAIHARGRSLQIYRQFPRDEATAASIRSMAASLPAWADSPFYRSGGAVWVKTEREVSARMTRHGRLLPIVTRGVVWDGMPLLVHAYKFEPDPFLKVELLPQAILRDLPDLPLRIVAKALSCHEYLVPAHVASPLPPYRGHEARFDTIAEYLREAMPEGLYATWYVNAVFPLPPHATSSESSQSC